MRTGAVAGNPRFSKRVSRTANGLRLDQVSAWVGFVRRSKKKNENPDKDASRIDDNIRAIKAYMTHYKDNSFTVLTTPKPIYASGQMEVTATPDLYVEEAGMNKLIKLDFNQRKPEKQAIDIILKVTYEAASAKQLGVTPKNVAYLDVSRKEQYNGGKLNGRLKKDVDAALATIEDMWVNIKQS